jgi:hypothetical protein
MTKIIRISHSSYTKAAEEAGIAPDQQTSLWERLMVHAEPSSRFTLINIVYFFGGLLIINALAGTLAIAWRHFAWWGVTVIATVCGLVFWKLGERLWKDGSYPTPGGILITAAVCMVPVVIFGIFSATGNNTVMPFSYTNFHYYIHSCWLPMEIATVAIGLLALKLYRFSFIMMPIALVLWYLPMDITAALHGNAFTWKQYAALATVVGIVMIVVAMIVDKKYKEDFSFWLYLTGAFSFWGGLIGMGDGGEVGKFFFFMINLLLIVFSVVVNRKIFIILGGLGAFGYIGYLTSTLFSKILYFPFLLAGIGLIIIYLGIKLQKNWHKIEQAILYYVPESIREYFPRR